jgi:hypothetical protein
MKPMVKAPGTKRLKVEYEPPSNFAFKFNLRRYILASDLTRGLVCRYTFAGAAALTDISGRAWPIVPFFS